MLSRRDLLAFAPGACAALAAPDAVRPPNLIVFLMDDQGYHDLGCQGARDLKTPHIDALALSGARLTNWYVMAPMCAPSRAALLTGRYPIRAGVPSNGPSLPPAEKTIASILKQNGYATGVFGKWHLGSDDLTSPNAHGFSRFFGFHSGCVDFYSHRFYWGEPRNVNYHDLWRDRTEVFEDGNYLTELIASEARAFVAANRNRPFFLYVPFNAVHYPMHAPKQYVERFKDLEPERRMYAAMLAAADDAIGAILGEVRRAGQLQNTMVVFQSDNGATREPRGGLNQQPATAGSNEPLRGFKFSLFDGGIRVPAIVSWPGRIPPKQVIDEPGCAMDILPTFLTAAGIPVPRDRTIDGRDVMPMLRSKKKSPHEALYWSSGGQLAVRRGKWKLVIDGISGERTAGRDGPLRGGDAMFLSDLEKDPGETANLSSREPALAAELAAQARRWLEDVKRN
jgi:arylsulfatase A-like enzyme